MINLEFIPKIALPDDVMSSAYREVINETNGSTPDIEFIRYLQENNSGLFEIIRPFIKLCKCDKEYKIMMGAIMATVKAIDVQLSCNELEGETL
jgi:hypothetical protein